MRPVPTAPVSLTTRDARSHAVAQGLAFLGAHPPGPVGRLRVEVRGPVEDIESGPEAWSVQFAADGARELPAHEMVDAVLRIGIEDLLDLAAGQADVALLYLAGRIEVEGDQALVLALGRELRLPGAARALVDPTALEPTAVSAAIESVPLIHLADVMNGGFRDLVLTEVFRRLPEFLIVEKAARVRLGVMFEIEHDTAGVDRYLVRIADGSCSVHPDARGGDDVDVTLVLSGTEFLRLVLGHLNPVRGVLSGEIRVRGQVLKALGFNSIMRIPGS